MSLTQAGESLISAVFSAHSAAMNRAASGLNPGERATLTALLYSDSTGKSGRLEPYSVEWMQAGGGVWHGGKPLEASTVPGDGRVRVLLGAYAGLRSPIPYPWPLSYLHVRLQDGEAWTFQPPAGHDVGWLAISVGSLRLGETTLRREMAVFEPGDGSIDVVAGGATEFVIGSAVKHPHPLALGSYSVHTSPEALRLGEAGIRRVAAELRAGR